MAENFLRFKPCTNCCTFTCVLAEDRFNCQDAVNTDLWEIKSGTWTLVDSTPRQCGQSRWQWDNISQTWTQIITPYLACTDDCVAVQPDYSGTYTGQIAEPYCTTGTYSDKVLWTWDGTDWTSSTDNCRYPIDEGYTACAAALTKPDYDGTTPGETVWRDCKQWQALVGNGGMILSKSPCWTENVFISVNATGVNVGDKFRIIFDYLDDDNYKYAEFEMGAEEGYGLNSIYFRSEGATTLISSCRSYWIVTSPTLVFTVCYTTSKNNSAEQLISANNGTFTATTGTIANETIGLAVTSGTISFKYFLAHKHSAAGQTAACLGCGFTGWSCFPNCSAHALSSGTPRTIPAWVKDDPTFPYGSIPFTNGDDWTFLQTWEGLYAGAPNAERIMPCYILEGAIEATFEFTLMEPFHPTYIFSRLYYLANTVTTTGGGGTTTPTNSGNILASGSARWTHIHTETCKVEVFNYQTGAWEIPPFGYGTYQNVTTQNITSVVGPESWQHDYWKSSEINFGFHHQHVSSSNTCKIRFTSTEGKLVIYRLSAGSEWYKGCLTLNVAGAQTGDCTCQYCDETNGAKDLSIGVDWYPSVWHVGKHYEDCRWMGVVCVGEAEHELEFTSPCYNSDHVANHGYLMVYRKGDKLMFEGLGFGFDLEEEALEIDVTGLDWETDSLEFPFTGGDETCAWSASSSLSVEQKEEACVEHDCYQKIECGNCNGPHFPDSMEVTFSGWSGGTAPCLCDIANDTFLLTKYNENVGEGGNSCTYIYTFPPPLPVCVPAHFSTILVDFSEDGWLELTIGSLSNVWRFRKQLGTICDDDHWDCLSPSTGGELWLDFWMSGTVTCSWSGAQVQVVLIP